MSKVQDAVHARVPYGKPCETQVAPFRFVASHCSPGSMKPLPQPTGPLPASAAATVVVWRSMTALNCGAVGAPSGQAPPFPAAVASSLVQVAVSFVWHLPMAVAYFAASPDVASLASAFCRHAA